MLSILCELLKFGSGRMNCLASTAVLARYMKSLFFDDETKTTGKFENMSVCIIFYKIRRSKILYLEMILEKSIEIGGKQIFRIF